MTYLHTNPQLIHLHKTAKEEIDAVDDVATLSRQRIAELRRGIPFVIRASVGQHILDHLDEIVTQKETSSGMLNTLHMSIRSFRIILQGNVFVLMHTHPVTIIMYLLGDDRRRSRYRRGTM